MVCFLRVVVVVQGSCVMHGEHSHENSTSLFPSFAVENIYNEGSESLTADITVSS